MFEAVEDVAVRLDLRTAVAGLTPKQRRAVECWLAGYTHAEIGERMGICRRAVGRLIERAASNLAQIRA